MTESQADQIIQLLAEIKSLLVPWLGNDFFSLILAFMLLVMFWLGFNAGSRVINGF